MTAVTLMLFRDCNVDANLHNIRKKNSLQFVCFDRATLCVSAVIAVGRCLSVCLSVCVFITLVYCIQMAKDINLFTSAR